MKSMDLSLPLDEKRQGQLVDLLSKYRLSEKKLKKKISALEAESRHNLVFGTAALAALSTIVMMFDRDLRFVYGNEGLIRKTFDIAEEIELKGLTLSEMVGALAPEDRVARIGADCERVLNTGERLSYDDVFNLSDGRKGYVNVTIVPAEDDNAGALGVVLLMENISDTVQLKYESESASRAKSTFLASISHEVRTPLNVIMGMTTLLNTTGLGEAQKGYVDSVLKAACSLLDIVNEILDFTKIDAREFDFTPAEYNLAELVADAANLISLKAKDKKLDFTIDFSPNLPTSLIGDALRIKQVLINLLSNAVKFTDSGGIVLRVCEAPSSHGFELEFVVEDSGAGIRREAIELLFTPFNGFDFTKSRRMQGMGLGLAICKGLLDAMHGEIFAESVYGEGSKFTVRLPQEVADSSLGVRVSTPSRKNVLILGNSAASDSLEKMLSQLFIRYTHINDPDEIERFLELGAYTHVIYWSDFAAELVLRYRDRMRGASVICVKERFSFVASGVAEGESVLFEPLIITDVAKVIDSSSTKREQIESEGAAPLGTFRTEGVRALVVDDHEINLIVANEILQKYAIEVTLASSGRQALDYIAETDFDIVFMDHMMPEMDGVETTLKIRELGGRNETIPIIALTANAVVGNKEQFIASRMDDYMSKPIEISQLNEIIMKWIPESKRKTGSFKKEESAFKPLSPELARLEKESGLNVRASMDQIGCSETIYFSILRTFINNARQKITALSNMVAGSDWEAFRIEIHAEKSALHNIGAHKLSEQAGRLELAAAGATYSYITQNFSPFIDGMTTLYERVSGLLPDDRKPRDASRLATPQQRAGLSAAAGRIIEFIDGLENEPAVSGINELLLIDFGDGINDVLSDVSMAIDSFDYDRAVELLQGLVNKDMTGG